MGVFALTAAGCGSGPEETAATGARETSFADIRSEARGQTVRWWMYGGDDRINAYVDERVKPAAERLGVKLERVPISDTTDAVQRVVAERRAGKDSGGAVDLIWINGENFAAGKQAGLWLEDWSEDLANSRYVDFSDPSISKDFQVPIEGQEAPWSRAALIYASDERRVSRPPRDLDALLTWARKHPGRFTYPAPPDFTGSAFVRQVVQAKGEDEAFAYLRQLKPLQYRRGRVLPKSEAELNRLFANDEVDFAMSYEPNFIATAVRRGQFPRSARPFVLSEGTLTNVSYVTIPANAAHRAGAQVVADLLLSPELQAVKADPEGLGIPSVLDMDRLPADMRKRFSALSSSPYRLDDLGRPLSELPAGRIAPLEERWKREVLR
ncbi:MAG: ABC transporter, substrate-binding protein YnjB [uncultured Solirubrobacteraceae bacterium]|uniref:ABC transporter, substrate-binding protein YnjB n=1 Tax=uncultured Solirubrobacteraceae bacterium TaxID=1162706 RepID=A0A6J4S8F4_9ACTN|nr:MAG: ABC transporter, substrate-binding protein YnjB [uncultured Solirubrobacteraceae bacterium]